MGLHMDLTQPERITELEEAMGNLLVLFQLAADLHRKATGAFRRSTMPHELDAPMFHACWRVLNQQDFELAQYCIDVLFTIYLPEGNAKSWFPDRDDKTIPPNPSRVVRKRKKLP